MYIFILQYDLVLVRCLILSPYVLITIRVLIEVRIYFTVRFYTSRVRNFITLYVFIMIRTYRCTYLFYCTFLYYKYKTWMNKYKPWLNRWNSNYCDCILENSNSKSINCRGCYLSTHYDFYRRESNRRNSGIFILVVATTNKIFTLVDLLCWWFW